MKMQFFSHTLFAIENSPSKCPEKGPVRPSATADHVRAQRAARSEPRISSRPPKFRNEDITPANYRRGKDAADQLEAHAPIIASKLARTRSHQAEASFGSADHWNK